MVVTVDEQLETESEDTSDSDSSDNNRYSCPFCGTVYKQHPKRCEHLLYEVQYVESNDPLISIPDHPIVASLFGVQMPRVVAGRFMHYLRSKLPNGSHSPSSIQTLDLLNKNINVPNVVGTQEVVRCIKYNREYPDCFREWTYYLHARPIAAMQDFVGFVKKHYVSDPPTEISFSRIQVFSEVMTLCATELMPDRVRAGTWVMLTGLPDNLPLFLFATTTSQGTTLLNHSANWLERMEKWNGPLPYNVALHAISRLPAIALN